MYRNKYGGLSNGDKTEGAKMNQVNARHEIIREWRSLPRELRQTDEQAAAFAMQIKDKYKFSSDSADHYQTVKDWLLRYLSITRGLARNAEDEGKMNSDAKSTDPGQSAAERKTLRSREAGEAIAEHESAQKAFHENRERLRGERLRREEAAGPMLYPAPELLTRLAKKKPPPGRGDGFRLALATPPQRKGHTANAGGCGLIENERGPHQN